MKALHGRVAVVTGAASGIGLALCRLFAAQEMSVVMADVDPAGLDAAAESVNADTGAEVLAVPTDVSHFEDVQALAERSRDRFGGVDVLCNNAGVTLSGRLWKIPLRDFDWVLRVNLWGAVHGIHAFVPAMIERGEPAHVVNTASISGVLGFARIGAYATSKFAVVGLSESLLHDLRERNAPIGVSVLCPGATATALTENSRRLRTGETVAVSTESMQESQAAPDEVATQVAPDEVATQVLQAIRENRFWILTHPGYSDLLEHRHRTMLGGAGELVAPGFFL